MESNALLELVGLFPSLAIAAIFIWYELKRSAQWSQEHREERQEREAERTKRDDEWRSFLTDQRNATLATLDVLALRLQQLGDVVMGIDDRTKRIEKAFDAHDTRAERIRVDLEGLRTSLTEGGKREKKD